MLEPDRAVRFRGYANPWWIMFIATFETPCTTG
jgi:hypothetical protein